MDTFLLQPHDLVQLNEREPQCGIAACAVLSSDLLFIKAKLDFVIAKTPISQDGVLIIRPAQFV